MNSVKLKSVISVFLLGVFVFSNAALAGNIENDLSVFEHKYAVTLPELVKPTVVRVRLGNDQPYGVVVHDLDSGNFQGDLEIDLFEDFETQFSVSESSEVKGVVGNLVDGNYETLAEFDLDRDDGNAYVVMDAEREITSTELRLDLDAFVALPHKIMIEAWEGDGWKTVVAWKKIESRWVNFPETKSSKWRVSFEHSQPLRLKELKFAQQGSQDVERGVEIRWLAQPEGRYVLYADADTGYTVPTSERGNLDVDEILIAEISNEQDNIYYVQSDEDEDGVIDLLDNCVAIVNRDQIDVDKNGKGDACEDFDGDSIVNDKDNCPNLPNTLQTDDDGDGIGDVCDAEESRITESNPWLVWSALGGVAVLVLFLILSTVKSGKKK